MAKEGSVNLKSLEGKDMNCYRDIGNNENPKSDLEKCHGDLKEEIQALIIKNMNSYILENVGKISEELKKVI